MPPPPPTPPSLPFTLLVPPPIMDFSLALGSGGVGLLFSCEEVSRKSLLGGSGGSELCCCLLNLSERDFLKELNLSLATKAWASRDPPKLLEELAETLAEEGAWGAAVYRKARGYRTERESNKEN